MLFYLIGDSEQGQGYNSRGPSKSVILRELETEESYYVVIPGEKDPSLRSG